MSKQKLDLSALGGAFVFSTDPDFSAPEPEPELLAEPSKQVLRIWLQRIKGNKEATVVKGFDGPDSQLADLAKTLKSKCATGGNAKDGEIILQGDHRDKVLKLLQEAGYTNVKKAGG
jgi:translation initiation factor 1